MTKLEPTPTSRKRKTAPGKTPKAKKPLAVVLAPFSSTRQEEIIVPFENYQTLGELIKKHKDVFGDLNPENFVTVKKIKHSASIFQDYTGCSSTDNKTLSENTPLTKLKGVLVPVRHLQLDFYKVYASCSMPVKDLRLRLKRMLKENVDCSRELRNEEEAEDFNTGMDVKVKRISFPLKLTCTDGSGLMEVTNEEMTLEEAKILDNMKILFEGDDASCTPSDMKVYYGKYMRFGIPRSGTPRDLVKMLPPSPILCPRPQCVAVRYSRNERWAPRVEQLKMIANTDDTNPVFPQVLPKDRLFVVVPMGGWEGRKSVFTRKSPYPAAPPTEDVVGDFKLYLKTDSKTLQEMKVNSDASLVDLMLYLGVIQNYNWQQFVHLKVADFVWKCKYLKSTHLSQCTDENDDEVEEEERIEEINPLTFQLSELREGTILRFHTFGPFGMKRKESRYKVFYSNLHCGSMHEEFVEMPVPLQATISIRPADCKRKVLTKSYAPLQQDIKDVIPGYMTGTHVVYIRPFDSNMLFRYDVLPSVTIGELLHKVGYSVRRCTTMFYGPTTNIELKTTCGEFPSGHTIIEISNISFTFLELKNMYLQFFNNCHQSVKLPNDSQLMYMTKHSWEDVSATKLNKHAKISKRWKTRTMHLSFKIPLRVKDGPGSELTFLTGMHYSLKDALYFDGWRKGLNNRLMYLSFGDQFLLAECHKPAIHYYEFVLIPSTRLTINDKQMELPLYTSVQQSLQKIRGRFVKDFFDKDNRFLVKVGSLNVEHGANTHDPLIFPEDVQQIHNTALEQEFLTAEKVGPESDVPFTISRVSTWEFDIRIRVPGCPYSPLFRVKPSKRYPNKPHKLFLLTPGKRDEFGRCDYIHKRFYNPTFFDDWDENEKKMQSFAGFVKLLHDRMLNIHEELKAQEKAKTLCEEMKKMYKNIIKDFQKEEIKKLSKRLEDAAERVSQLAPKLGIPAASKLSKHFLRLVAIYKTFDVFLTDLRFTMMTHRVIDDKRKFTVFYNYRSHWFVQDKDKKRHIHYHDV